MGFAEFTTPDNRTFLANTDLISMVGIDIDEDTFGEYPEDVEKGIERTFLFIDGGQIFVNESYDEAKNKVQYT